VRAPRLLVRWRPVVVYDRLVHPCARGPRAGRRQRHLTSRRRPAAGRDRTGRHQTRSSSSTGPPGRLVVRLQGCDRFVFGFRARAAKRPRLAHCGRAVFEGRFPGLTTRSSRPLRRASRHHRATSTPFITVVRATKSRPGSADVDFEDSPRGGRHARDPLMGAGASLQRRASVAGRPAARDPRFRMRNGTHAADQRNVRRRSPRSPTPRVRAPAVLNRPVGGSPVSDLARFETTPLLRPLGRRDAPPASSERAAPCVSKGSRRGHRAFPAIAIEPLASTCLDLAPIAGLVFTSRRTAPAAFFRSRASAAGWGPRLPRPRCLRISANRPGTAAALSDPLAARRPSSRSGFVCESSAGGVFSLRRRPAGELVVCLARAERPHVHPAV